MRFWGAVVQPELLSHSAGGEQPGGGRDGGGVGGAAVLRVAAGRLQLPGRVVPQAGRAEGAPSVPPPPRRPVRPPAPLPTSGSAGAPVSQRLFLLRQLAFR